ncbi:hypothetical protein HPP92_022638 [Vanilla planifolia]|uniref:F-box domain-containing protein n=1 Tax=Vanilla planifolia TaxID=51239 RepID=A0A835UCD0_VANPL|nr:hypothetical protein HPP92_022921 [Vanilla planifolia]KAG0459510.1 hypothetical protein HPP92_022638 [Vanilla planifolia]
MALSVSTAGGDRLVRGKDGGCEEISSIAFSSPPALRPPSHLFARVFSQLDCIDLLNCSLVCKHEFGGSDQISDPVGIDPHPV